MLELMKYTGIVLALISLVAYVFYRSFIAVILFSPAIPIYLIINKKRLIERRRDRLEEEFKEAIIVFTALLNAGYSMENAVRESLSQLKSMYKSMPLIISELEIMQKGIRMNMPVEKLFEELGERSGVEDIRNLARVIRIAKRSGGEMVSIMNNTVQAIQDRARLKRELLLLTSAKRFEQKIMNVFPVVIILYVNLTSPELFGVMYTSLAGRIVMSVCLMVYVLAIYISKKILDIEV